MQAINLSFAWRLGPDKPVFSHEPEAAVTFDKPGTYPVELTLYRLARRNVCGDCGNPRRQRAADDHVFKNLDTAASSIGAIEFAFVSKQPMRRMETHKITQRYGRRLRVQGQYFAQRPGSASDHEGLAGAWPRAHAQTTCFSCHSVQATTGGGPPYFDVSRKYHDQPAARDQLARKILSGGTAFGVRKPMPAHPQHSLEQARLMADWVLSLAAEGMGDGGRLAPTASSSCRQRLLRRDAGVYVLSASYADQGADGAPSLTGEATLVLHSRKMQAVACDRRHGVELVEVFVVGPAGRFSNGGWIAFDDMDLHGIDHVDCTVAQAGMARRMLGTCMPMRRTDRCSGSPRYLRSNGAELIRAMRRFHCKTPDGPCTLFVIARAKQRDGWQGCHSPRFEVCGFRQPAAMNSNASNRNWRSCRSRRPRRSSRELVVKVWTLDDLKPVFDHSGQRPLVRTRQSFVHQCLVLRPAIALEKRAERLVRIYRSRLPV